MIGSLESSRAILLAKNGPKLREIDPQNYIVSLLSTLVVSKYSQVAIIGCTWLKIVCQSIIPGVLGCLESIRSYNLPKMARNDQKLTPNLYYWAIEYSDDLKTLPIAMNGCIQLKLVSQSIIPVVLGCLESIRSYSWPKMAQNDRILTPDLYY